MLEMESVVPRLFASRRCVCAPLWWLVALVFAMWIRFPAHAGERLLPLSRAEVAETAGAVVGGPSQQERKPLTQGMFLANAHWLQTGSASRLELRFSDGTILRLSEKTRVTLFPVERRIWLSAGRVLVMSDRMTGGLAVLSELAAFVPEGTSYLVEATPKTSGQGLSTVTVTVVEGAVCACSTDRSTANRIQAKRDAIVLPGEQMTIDNPSKRPSPIPVKLADLVRSEPLWMGFHQKLPDVRWVTENLDQQRRGILAQRNARLRREIFWKRPPHAPVPPPKQFIEPAGPPKVEYEFPE